MGWGAQVTATDLLVLLVAFNACFWTGWGCCWLGVRPANKHFQTLSGGRIVKIGDKSALSFERQLTDLEVALLRDAWERAYTGTSHGQN